MLFVFKRKKLILASVMLAVILFLSGVASEKFMPDEPAFLPSEGKTVIIDAGHPALTQYQINFLKKVLYKPEKLC